MDAASEMLVYAYKDIQISVLLSTQTSVSPALSRRAPRLPQSPAMAAIEVVRLVDREAVVEIGATAVLPGK